MAKCLKSCSAFCPIPDTGRRCHIFYINGRGRNIESAMLKSFGFPLTGKSRHVVSQGLAWPLECLDPSCSRCVQLSLLRRSRRQRLVDSAQLPTNKRDDSISRCALFLGAESHSNGLRWIRWLLSPGCRADRQLLSCSVPRSSPPVSKS